MHIMAEIINTKTKKQPRVDLTPMVDLGFLLITLFVFTTSLAKPAALNLIMPDDRPTPNPSLAAESKTMNILLDANGWLWTYKGKNIHEIQHVSAYNNGLRKKILSFKNNLIKQFGSDTAMVVLIKPLQESSYQQLIDCLDEMKINAIKRYALVDASPEDLQFIHTKHAAF